MVIGHSKGPGGHPGLQGGVANPPSLGSMMVPRYIGGVGKITMRPGEQIGNFGFNNAYIYRKRSKISDLPSLWLCSAFLNQLRWQKATPQHQPPSIPGLFPP